MLRQIGNELSAYLLIPQTYLHHTPPPRFLLFSGATKEEEEQSEKAKALKLIRIFSPFFLCACFTYTFLIRVFCLPVSAIAEAQKNSEGIGSASFVVLVVVRSRASQTFLLSPPHRNK